MIIETAEDEEKLARTLEIMLHFMAVEAQGYQWTPAEVHKKSKLYAKKIVAEFGKIFGEKK